MLHRFITISIALISINLSGFAQKNEIGLMLGASNYHGDLAYQIVPKESYFSGGGYYRVNFNEYWSMRPTVSYMRIGGADSNFAEYELRNLSFTNNIYEVSNIMEFNFQPFSSRYYHQHNTFYLMAGIAGFYHNPKANLNGEIVELRRAQTENVDYSPFQISVPFGAGFKQSLGKNLILGLEVGWRKTFTDHLDDVSTVYPSLETESGIIHPLADRSWEVSESGQQLANEGDMRGDPNFKDYYFQTAFTISYRFTPIQCPF